MKILGVIGGLGPIATAYFYELIIKMTDASCDQEHMELIIHSRPSIPDRTAFILDPAKPSPGPDMAEVAKSLETQGAACLAIPCVTAHCFYEEVAGAVRIPILHAVRELAAHLQAFGVQKVGILATDGTLACGLLQRELHRHGRETVILSSANQASLMHVIYRNVKANRPVELEKFQTAAQELREKGADVILLGCTELSLIKRDYDIGSDYIDVLDVLAMRSIQECGAPLKPQYRGLLVK